LQVMTKEEADKESTNPFDLTKVNNCKYLTQLISKKDFLEL